MSKSPQLYIEDPTFSMPRKILSNEIYTEAMEALIIVCADVIFINRESGTLFLAWRRAKPLLGWWCIGGRINAGEKESEGVARVAERETSLKIALERFVFLRMNRYICSTREQKPQQVGSDTLAYTFFVNISKEEKEIISQNLEETEYDRAHGLREFNRPTLVNEKVHKAIIEAYDQIFNVDLP